MNRIRNLYKSLRDSVFDQKLCKRVIKYVKLKGCLTFKQGRNVNIYCFFYNGFPVSSKKNLFFKEVL